MATRVRSYSKINLGLAIGPVRPDGFHGLATLYQTLALHDVVTVEAKLSATEGESPEGSSNITLTTNDARVPTDSRNTAWKMVELALERMGVAAEVAIHIEKRLPVEGGMGAGSANAAAALIGLERELGLTRAERPERELGLTRAEYPERELGLTRAEYPERELGFTLSELARMEVAAEVGSDVPLFLVGGAVEGMERGERVRAMADLPPTWCVVAVPEVGVSTPRAFEEWDSLCARKASSSERVLTSSSGADRLKQLSHVYATVLGAGSEYPSANQTEPTPDTSGIVRGRQGLSHSETKKGGFEEQSFTSEQGSALNGLAGNTLLALVRTGIENDFEQVVFPQYPLLGEIKRVLMGTPAGESADSVEARPDDPSGNALYAALSGSGSALFGLYRSETDARAAQRRVQDFGCKALLTQTLPRPEYWRTMFAE